MIIMTYYVFFSGFQSLKETVWRRPHLVSDSDIYGKGDIADIYCNLSSNESQQPEKVSSVSKGML